MATHSPASSSRPCPDERKLFCEIAIMSSCPRGPPCVPQADPAPDKLGSKDGARRSLVVSQALEGSWSCQPGRAVLLGAEASLTSGPPPALSST